jgi:putative zinc finger/helix-turn-helix YgiT family protein
MKETKGEMTAISPTISEQCPNCDSRKVSARRIVDRFDYGVGRETVQLSAEIPAYECADCGLQYSGDEAERLRHEAVCNYLQLLVPARIAEIRSNYGLSRAKFAEISRIGMATLSRWESGETLQNAAMDMYMRLLGRPDIYRLVTSGELFVEQHPHKVSAHKETSASTTKFRALDKRDPVERVRLTQRSREFSLQGEARAA